MKKNRILTLITACFYSISTFAQSPKEELGLKLKEDFSWMSGTVVDQLVKINISQSLWDVIIANEKFPKGIKSFDYLGSYLMETHDYMYDSHMKGRCDDRPSKDMKKDCEAELIASKNKLNLTINAPKIKYTDISYRLLMGYLSTVDSFLGNTSCSYGFNRGWRPKTAELHLIIELSETAKDIKVTWSSDGKTGTVTGPAYNEVNEWDSKIWKGLDRGGIK